jgi:small conductance mechanosensitive channel
MVFGISYEDDISKAKAIINSILSADNRILKEPEPQVVVAKLDSSSVNINVRPWVKTPDYWPVYFDLLELIKKKFDEENITIPYPQQDVHLYNK